jgi:uncharacterized protein (DUF433 family)
MFSKETLLNRIEIDPKIMVGKPVIKGTRLPVHQILRLLSQGISTEEIMQDFDITKEDVLACLLYATEMLENTAIMPITAL